MATSGMTDILSLPTRKTFIKTLWNDVFLNKPVWLQGIILAKLDGKMFTLQDESGEISVDYGSAFVPSTTSIREGMYAMVIGTRTPLEGSKRLTASKVQDLTSQLPLAQEMWPWEIRDAETYG